MAWGFRKVGPHETIKIKVLEGCVVGGVGPRSPGDVLTVPAATAWELQALGSVEFVSPDLPTAQADTVIDEPSTAALPVGTREREPERTRHLGHLKEQEKIAKERLENRDALEEEFKSNEGEMAKEQQQAEKQEEQAREKAAKEKEKESHADKDKAEKDKAEKKAEEEKEAAAAAKQAPPKR
jgi:colicin import membrane protein